MTPIHHSTHKTLSISLAVIITSFIFSCEKDELLRIPKVETKTTSEIMATTAMVNGEIIDLGEGISDYGHCWGIASNPVITDSRTSFGLASKTGTYTSNLSELEPGMVYHVRAYMKSGNDIVYGKDNVFTTLDGKVHFTTNEVSIITKRSAICGGNITSVNGDSVLLRGICWDSLSTVNMRINTGLIAKGSGLGQFTAELTNLIPGKKYFVKAWAITNIDTSYAMPVAFTTFTGVAMLSTTTVSSITANSAICGGEITNDGGLPVTSRGVCWNTNQNPTLSDSKTVDSLGIGSFSSRILGLQADQTYFVRAYASNSDTTVYGNQQTFTTKDGKIVITTIAITNLTSTSATSGGDIRDDGGFAITSRGICWSTEPNPTIEDNISTEGTGTGIFTSGIPSLSPNTTYYVRAFANNSAGTAYGNEISFKTNLEGTGVTDIEGNYYSAVTIGTQVWMAENLKATKYNDGTSISNITDKTIWATLTSPAYCWYNNDEVTNKSIYGAMYNWYAVSTRKLCPTGWHVPTDAEWKTLEIFLEMAHSEADGAGWRGTDQGSQLKSNTGWNSDGNGTNSVGFSALPGGDRGNDDGSFSYIGEGGGWWSATEDGSSNAWFRYLRYQYNNVYRGNGSGGSGKSSGYSVRCLLGNEIIDLPELTTTEAHTITQTTAIIGGSIISDGGVNVTARGICWSTHQNPTTADNKTTDGSDIGSFTSSLSGLNPNTTYFVRAYATTIAGTAYGNQVSFTTIQSIDIPTLSTIDATDIAQTTATSGGNISSDGGAIITSRGVCWSTSQNPTTADNKTNDGSEIGSFTSSLTGLIPNTTYYVRAYATNIAGTAYGDNQIFKTLIEEGEITDRDGNLYTTVTIGAQVWMAENLRTTTYNDGTAIPNITDNTIWYNQTTPAYCWYNNDAATYKSSYGALYNWYAVNTSKLCPTGWHIPNDAEWAILIDYLGGESVAGGKLKETGITHWASPNEGATNETGFSALPGGDRLFNNGNFSNANYFGRWWSTTMDGDLYAWSRIMSSGSKNMLREGLGKGFGCSVRCLQGNEIINLPELVTTEASEITQTSAISGGNITSDGGANVTARGVCWSTSQNPTTAGNKTTNGIETGSYISNLAGLNPNTTYYVRAYATNSSGTAYGNQVSFTTLQSAVIPTLTTIGASDIGQTTASSGGIISSDGGGIISEHGVCWSTDQNPTTANNKTSDGSGIGSFSSSLTGLSPGTLYYVRAYATNSAGTAYGIQISFATLTVPTVTNLSGKIWMDRNLGASRVATSSTDSEAYGDLYQWGRGTDGHEKRNSPTTSTLSNSNSPGHGSFILANDVPYDWRSMQNDDLWQGVSGTNNPCPAGFRLPTVAEWEAERASWNSNNAAGAFASPLKLPLAGLRYLSNGSLNHVGSSGLYWSATTGGAYCQDLDFDSLYAGMSSDYRANGSSVRCLKDLP